MKGGLMSDRTRHHGPTNFGWFPFFNPSTIDAKISRPSSLPNIGSAQRSGCGIRPSECARLRRHFQQFLLERTALQRGKPSTLPSASTFPMTWSSDPESPFQVVLELDTVPYIKARSLHTLILRL
jgi:hypothetical protein